MSDNARAGRPPVHEENTAANNPRRDFIKVMVTAVAGLTVAGTGDASAAPADRFAAQTTVTSETQQKLEQALADYAAALSTGSTDALKPFFSATIDFRSNGPIVRTWSEVEAQLATDQLLFLRANAFITHVKWLAPNRAIVDGNFALGTARAWFTEVWQGPDKFTIDVTRLRGGSTDASFQALDALRPGTIADGIDPELAFREETALRDNFRAFRAAFNAGDVKGVTGLTTGSVDAIPVFSFLEGRAQILESQAAVQTKAARMLGDQAVSSPTVVGGSAVAQRATYVAGEPKIVRFLSASLALVDGTAEINNIPSAHEFSPSAMRGVYSTVWAKGVDGWKAEATRPWF